MTWVYDTISCSVQLSFQFFGLITEIEKIGEGLEPVKQFTWLEGSSVLVPLNDWQHGTIYVLCLNAWKFIWVETNIGYFLEWLFCIDLNYQNLKTTAYPMIIFIIYLKCRVFFFLNEILTNPQTKEEYKMVKGLNEFEGLVL